MPDSTVTVDAHQHYWQIQNFEYPWHKQVNRPEMQRDYMPSEILPKMQALGIQYSVLIQADNSLDETTWMLNLAEQYPSIAGVVGRVDLTAHDMVTNLDKLAQQSLFRGIRLTPAPQEDWRLLSPGLQALAERGLSCDLLLREDTLTKARAMMHAHADTSFVVNHLAGLSLTPGGVRPWTEKLKPLSELPNVSMKFSAIQGLAEPPPISTETLWPYLESALTLFGEHRLIFASDWPVSTLTGPYEECITVMRAATSRLSKEEQAAIWGGNAITTYKLSLRLQK